MDLFLHVGMQRTGSTFLQYNVFPEINEINLVDFDIVNNETCGNKEVKQVMMNLDNADEDIISKKVTSRFNKNKINLISEENTYCKMFTKTDRRFSQLEKLKEFFPDAKVIFGTRNKEDLLGSWYVKYVMKGGTLGLKDYLEQVENIKKLDYEPYVEALYKKFGKANVYVYNFEDLTKDTGSFVDDLCDFIGVDKPEFKNVKRNVSYSLNQVKLSLFFNHFFKTPLNPKGIISIPEFYIPHRYLFHSKFFANKPREKLKLEI